MKTYLITGCAGFIGSNFVHYMLKKYPEILLVNLDKLTYAGNLENLKDVEGDPRHVFVQGDICDKELVESLFAKYDFDYVINFAAESHVDRSIKNPEIFVQSNVMGTVNLLQRAKEAWYDADAKTWKEGKKYLQVSTDEVYGALGAVCVKELHYVALLAQRIRRLYAAVRKLAAHYHQRLFVARGGAAHKVVRARVFCVYYAVLYQLVNVYKAFRQPRLGYSGGTCVHMLRLFFRMILLCPRSAPLLSRRQALPWRHNRYRWLCSLGREYSARERP